jgi:hypothetical protein
LSKALLALVIHSHQPVGNFDHVVEEAYQKSYAPFVRGLSEHPHIRLSLHYSGVLLEWIETRHPEFFSQLRELIARRQVELMGGGHFEPILPAIPDTDKLAQIRKLTGYLRHHFGAEPTGAWIAERVWEPSLARPLAEAGVEYTVLDDTHFLAAGLEPAELHGAYITEEAGASLRLVPSLTNLRYTIPFQEPQETLRILSEGRNGTGPAGPLFAMGDDCEKFGVWPGTYDHCYTNKWLERFFVAIEGAAEWLETVTLAQYLSDNRPLGRIYLPTASYAEMMEWALPAGVSTQFRTCLEESERTPAGERYRRFLRGGMWRNFLSKYPESNNVHKFMLEISRRCQSALVKTPAGSEQARLVGEAEAHLLAGQCNDAYWHGVFGGLYAPHLRSALLRHLIQAETLLDRIDGSAKAPTVSIATKDFDVDGDDEVLVEHPVFGMVLRPADGGTVSSLRFKPADVELINSLVRRPEPYHRLVGQGVTPEKTNAGAASIHERVVSKESNLAALLHYDRYSRHAFRTYVFPAAKQVEDFDQLRLEENEDLARSPWTLIRGHAAGTGTTLKLLGEVLFRSNGDELKLSAEKTLVARVAGSVWELDCKSAIATDHRSVTPLALGVELVFNLLAPNAPDRYFLLDKVRLPLEFHGEIDAPRLILVDGWQRVKLSLDAYPRARWWVVPIQTISQSESGFERIYQGSAILAVWRFEPPSEMNIACTLRIEIAQMSVAPA